MTDAINCIQALPTAQQSDLQLASEVQTALLSVRQQEQIAAQTFNQWKEKAGQRIDQVQLPLVQRLSQAVDRLTSNLIGTPCGDDTASAVTGFLAGAL